MKIYRIMWVMGLALGLSACGGAEDGAANGKGEEEQQLNNLGKADSFFKPTEHGRLQFGFPQQAALSEGALFHAWDFVLSGPAKVTLETEISKNLDTVMYLYRRAPGTSSWGRFFRKNDDHKGSLASRIEFEEGEAEYRIIVKGHKKALRGSFSLVGQCEGEGCKRVDEPNETCDPDVFSGFPGGIEADCTESVHEIFSTPVTAETGFGVPVSERCELDRFGALGIEYYVAYWDEFFGFEDFAGEEDPVLNIGITTHGDKGTVVGVDIGGDEDFVAFVFNGDGELVMLFHDEQSPTLTWFCDEATVEDVDEDCAARTIYELPHGATNEDNTKGETTVASAEDDLDVLMAAGVKHFAETLGLGEEQVMEFEAVRWIGRFEDGGARLTLTALDTVATYTLADNFGEPVLVFLETNDKGLQYTCQSLE